MEQAHGHCNLHLPRWNVPLYHLWRIPLNRHTPRMGQSCAQYPFWKQILLNFMAYRMSFFIIEAKIRLPRYQEYVIDY